MFFVVNICPSFYFRILGVTSNTRKRFSLACQSGDFAVMINEFGLKSCFYHSESFDKLRTGLAKRKIYIFQGLKKFFAYPLKNRR
jgi:hypothetical protein